MAKCSKCGNPTAIWHLDLFSRTCPECRGVRPRATSRSTLENLAPYFGLLSVLIIVGYSVIANFKSEISTLRSTVQEMKEAIDFQSNQIEKLQSAVKRDSKSFLGQ